MACSIIITEVIGIPQAPGSSIVDAVVVKGTAQGCDGINLGASSFHLQITVTCSSGSQNSANVTVIHGQFEGEVKINCECETIVKIEVVCLTDPTCTDAFEGPLPCNPPADDECPDITVTMQVGDCDENGLQQVTFTAHVNALGTVTPVVAEYNYGDGTTGSAFLISAPGDIVELAHGYLPGTNVTATLNIIQPPTCQSIQIPVDLTGQPTCDIECPVIDQVNVSVGACNDDGTRTVTLTGLLSGGQPSSIHWEFGTPDAAEQTIMVSGPQATVTTTHNYPANGSGTTTYTAVLTVTAADGQCVDSFPVQVEIEGCDTNECPTVDDVTANMGPCISETQRRVGLNVSITGGGFTEYEWDFGDGTTQTIDPSVQGNPSTSHDYEIGNTYTATLTTTAPDGCEDQSGSATFGVNDCGTSTPPKKCGSMLFIILALLVIAVGATIFTLALETCPALAAIPVPTWVWGVIAGLWVAVAAAIALSYILCWLEICDCLTACDWAVLGWGALITMGILMMLLSGCCLPFWLPVGIGLFVLGAAAFGLWYYKCQPGRCYALDLLSVVFVTIAATAITYILIVPAIQACALTWVEVGVATLGAAIVTATAICHSGE